MAFSICAEFEEIKSEVAGNIPANYVPIGTPLEHAAREGLIQNLTDVTLMFSDDGITDKFRLPRMSYREIDYTANETSSNGFFLEKGRQFWVKQDGAAPTTGTVNISCIYGLNE